MYKNSCFEFINLWRFFVDKNKWLMRTRSVVFLIMVVVLMRRRGIGFDEKKWCVLIRINCAFL